MSDMRTDPSAELEAYLRRFDRELRTLPPDERAEIVREARSHVLDRIATETTSIQDVLGELGPPEKYAKHFLVGDEDGEDRGTLPTLLRAASRGPGPLVAFLGAVFGYGISFLLLVAGLLKIVHPERSGLWTDASVDPPLWTLSLRTGPRPPAGTEILGWWYLVIALGLSLGVFVVATLLIRRLSRGSRRV